MNRYGALFVLGGIGTLFAGGGIILAISAAALQRVFNSEHWVALTAFRSGMLIAILGLCLVIVGYSEFRRR